MSHSLSRLVSSLEPGKACTQPGQGMYTQGNDAALMHCNEYLAIVCCASLTALHSVSWAIKFHLMIWLVGQSVMSQDQHVPGHASQEADMSLPGPSAPAFDRRYSTLSLCGCYHLHQTNALILQAVHFLKGYVCCTPDYKRARSGTHPPGTPHRAGAAGSGKLVMLPIVSCVTCSSTELPQVLMQVILELVLLPMTLKLSDMSQSHRQILLRYN